jgi:hypothetical protein
MVLDTLHAAIESIDSLIDPVESLIHPVESLIHPIESLIHLPESSIHPREAIGHLCLHTIDPADQDCLPFRQRGDLTGHVLHHRAETRILFIAQMHTSCW